MDVAGDATALLTRTRPLPQLASALTGIAVAGVVVIAGLTHEVPLLTLGWAAAFVLCAVEVDVRAFRIPNILTFTTLCAALALGIWEEGSYGFVQAALGAAVGLALLLPFYAFGGLGAGDVKAVVALGAWIGPLSAAGLAIRALLLAAVIASLWLIWRREFGAFARRWFAVIATSFSLGRLNYLAPPPGSAASSGVPFAAAVGLGLAWQWYGGGLL